MTTFNIDNSDSGDLLRSVTWQFDQANGIVGIIQMFKSFYDESTKDFLDGLMEQFNLTDTNITDYGLSVWGKILGIQRPYVTISGTKTIISSSLYRRIMLAKIQLLNKDATVPNYIKYVDDIFGGWYEGTEYNMNVKVTDNKNMSLSFSANTGNDLTAEELACLTQIPDIVFSFPCGVRSATHSDSLMFGLSTTNSSPQDSSCGGLDESYFCWRYTVKGNWR